MRILKLLVCILTALLMITGSAFAAGASHGDSHAADVYSIKFHFINFAIYAALILFIAKKKLPGAWAARRQSLEKSITSSREKLNNLQKTYNETKVKLQNADQDVITIRRNIAEETKRETEEVQNSARAAIQRIEKQVKDTLGAEQRNFENAMRKIYTEAALKLAQEKIKSLVNQDSDKALRDSTLNNLRELIN